VPAPILQFLGGAGTVTGSRFLLETGASRLLVDCGLFQGHKKLRLRNWLPFPVDPATIDAVVVTHAHLDHVGYLPALVRDGFDGPILCTRFTADLTRIVLDDSARLQQEEAAYANRAGYSKHHPALPLYTEEDAARAGARLRTVEFGAAVEAAPGVEAVLRPAGHILGSATVTLSLGQPTHTLVFTGDLGRPNHPLLLPPEDPPRADVVVTESTYGDRHHENETVADDTLAEAISRTARRGGLVVIPAFAVDRTEVVLMALGRLADQRRIPPLPIYVDSPMALAVLDVYRSAIARGDAELRPTTGDPFRAAGQLHEVPTPQGSRALNDLHSPSVIISASGMASGGRVLHHLAHRLPDPRNTIILAGFQAPGTRGQLLADGAPAIKLLGHHVPVRADVVQIGGYSVHADTDEIIRWLGRMPGIPDVAYVTHGEPEASQALRHRLAHALGWNAVVARADERVLVD
jgi:metallo-beta-lactamase family protein